MTKEDFVKGYAARSNWTLEQLKEQRFYPAPCDCDYEDCKGWQMKHIEHDFVGPMTEQWEMEWPK